MKNISIVIVTNDGSTVLRQTLPEIMAQQYDAAFEVIVVRETLKGEMKDILEPFLEQYSNLYTTYLPDKPLYVSDGEIEILLGVKAAKYDDIIIVHPGFMPYSDQWLKDVGALLDINEEYPILIGNAHYCDKGFFFRRRHNNKVAKLLKPWCKTKGIRRKDLMLSKNDSHDFGISFHRNDYLSDLPLRDIIASHCDA